MVKKAYIITIILLFFASKNLFGQRYQLGIYFNPNITWLQTDVDDIVPGDVRFGYEFGFSLDRYFTENYAFASGVSILHTGGTLKHINGIEKFRLRDENVEIAKNKDVRYNIQYARVPIALKLKTHLIGRMVYSANLGFDVMFRTTANADFEDVNNKQYDRVNINKEIKLLNLGWHIGGGVAYHLGGDASIFGGVALMNTFTDMTTPSRDMITSKNLVLRIGVMF